MPCPPHRDESRRAAYHYAVELIGRRWNGAILWVLLGGPRRFGEIAAAVPGVSDRMLANRLRELASERLVARVVTARMPVLVTYELTPMGRDLEPVVEAIGRWAERWAPAGAPPGRGGQGRGRSLRP
ncbi:helix-turn-helix domain-containing protein [Streptomyces sp. MP131-18]|uniref:winged helix-turn-helix transcriptional regulator n=1 Tax=Streptomyces sp. MP131-18 TaxID=1857892 RepID=UPI00097C6A31|nr:helix-turn-helix domain-containing protein [Streptomyces sp. MP131-18]ONK11656.1 HTH-type transcriptional regulator YodB [Streptomyces sp. MP131-18]